MERLLEAFLEGGLLGLLGWVIISCSCTEVQRLERGYEWEY